MASPSVFPANPPNLRVGSEINRGAWGVVYEGDLDGRPVAVKNIHELLRQVGKEELERLMVNFREECARLQALVHPHIVGKECAPVRSAPLVHAYVLPYLYLYMTTIASWGLPGYIIIIIKNSMVIGM